MTTAAPASGATLLLLLFFPLHCCEKPKGKLSQSAWRLPRQPSVTSCVKRVFRAKRELQKGKGHQVFAYGATQKGKPFHFDHLCVSAILPLHVERPPRSPRSELVPSGRL